MFYDEMEVSSILGSKRPGTAERAVVRNNVGIRVELAVSVIVLMLKLMNLMALWVVGERETNFAD